MDLKTKNMISDKKIVILTLNYNQNNYTIKCINSILKSKYDNYKVLVVDNGSTMINQIELEHNLVKDDKIILKKLTKNRGYVGGINYGLMEGAKLKPDFFLVMNNDTIIDDVAIGEFVNEYENLNIKAIITGKVYHYDQPDIFQYVGAVLKNKKLLKYSNIGLNKTDVGQFDKLEYRDMIDDIFWLFPIELYHEIGGYSPFFWFNAEQADFALRAKKVGYKLVFTPKAKIWHKGSVSIGGRDKNPKVAFWTVQSALTFRYFHLKKMDFIVYYLVTLKSVLGTFIKSMFHKFIKNRDFTDYALAKYKGLMYFNRWLFKKNKNTGYNPFS